MPSLSIVIPAYNVEKYLAKCAASICKQTLEDIEIIIVDDGSTDSSGRIADRLSFTDSRIKVIHQDNCGLGPARNAGIDVATGAYVGFVDSDDWVEPEMFEILFKKAKEDNSDVCAGGFKTVENGRTKDVHEQPLANVSLVGRNEIDAYRLNFYGPQDDSVQNQPLVAAWVRIYKKSLLDEKQLRFKNIRSEDVDFNIRVMRESEIISFTSGSSYCYRKDGQPSITNGMSLRMIEQYESLIAALEDSLKEENSDIYQGCFERLQRGVFGYMRTLVNVCALSGASLRELSIFSKEVLESPRLSRYLENYPVLNMSYAQRILLWCMAHRNADSTAVLFWARNKVSL